MKTRTVSSLAVVLLGGVITTGTFGCAGTRTSRSTGEYIDDAALTTKVKTALLRDSVAKGLQVNVDTFKGVVQLNGFVDTLQEKARAEDIARNTPGVVRVDDELAVKTDVTH